MSEEKKKRVKENRFFLIDKEAFNLEVNYATSICRLNKLDFKRSSSFDFINGDNILHTTLTIDDYINYDDMKDKDFNLIMRSCINLAKQILKFKYQENDNTTISTIESYEKLFPRWEEKQLAHNPNEITLDSVILPEDKKEGILETVNFMKDIELYTEIGAILPAGILLEGPPGCGKSTVAKAIAGECNVAYKSICAPDFMQHYVGDSAKEVDKVFKELKEAGGGILFIDEVDAIATKRLHDDNAKEYRNCLNKLLACMSDAQENNIIVICATNLKEQLDSAFIREGRIDKVIKVDLPDYECRVKLFELYVGKLKHEDDIDYELLAELSKDRNGAFIAAVCNHAAIHAVKNKCKKVNQEHLLYSLDKMISNRDQDKKESSSIGFI